MEDKFQSQRIMSTPPTPRSRRSIKLGTSEGSSNSNTYNSHIKSKTSRLQKSSEDESYKNINHDKQITESSSEQDEEVEYFDSQTRSRTTSPAKEVFQLESCVSKKALQCKKREQAGDTSNFPYLLSIIIIILIIIILVFSSSSFLSKSEKQKQPINNPNLLLSESIENVKAKFYNQELDIWNDIASAINEVMSRDPKTPSIILLFANETTTMNCLATNLANVSSTVLHTGSPLYLIPKHFGDDAGEIINKLNKYSPPKKVVVIRDILSINTEAIKALHNLCDRINPLIQEVIYILTMQTTTYQSSQKKLAFVEEQIYHKLSKNIDQDILMALVTRITDGAIILVQPEPHLRYC